MSKKVNPRKKPHTEEDVQRAHRRGRTEAIEFSLAVACLSVHDTFSPSKEQMEAFHKKYTQNVEAILSRDITYKDVLEVLDTEYALEIEFT